MRKFIFIPILMLAAVFTIIMPNTVYAVTEFVCLIRYGQTISNITESASDTVTVTLSSAYPNSNLKVGQKIRIDGTTNYNGTFTITTVNSTSEFVYSQTNTSRASESTGTAGGDYSALSTWEGSNQCNLTSSKVFSHGGITGTIADGASVTGAGSSATGTVCHATGTQILIKNITGTFDSGEQVQVDVSNYVTISDAGDSVLAVAECYNDWSTGMTNQVFIADWAGSSATNYVKVYVPPAERHNGVGKDDSGSYTGFTMRNGGNWTKAINMGDPYIHIDGVAFDLGLIYSNAFGLYTGTAGQTADLAYVDHCIAFNGSSSSFAYYIHNASSSGIYLRNCLAYDVAYGFYMNSYTKGYLYNCTAVNCSGIGIYLDSSQRYQTAKNCLAYNNGTDFSRNTTNVDLLVEYCASSDDTADDPDPDGAGNRISQTFSFFDEDNNDFHLFTSDSGARGYGEDLSADETCPLSDDLDRNTRIVPWDIGVDQSPAMIYRSVGPSSTSALVTGSSSNTLTIDDSAGTATFSADLALNIGIGDVIQYDDGGAATPDSLAFICGRTSATVFTVRKADGYSMPTATSVNQNWSISRAYSSLSDAEKGVENTAVYSAIRNFDDWTAGGDYSTDDVGRDLVTSNEQWNIVCYADAADTTAVTIDGWTTSKYNYLKIYTPVEITETGVLQRHNGIWNTKAYRLEITAAANDTKILNINEENVRIEGLQFALTNSGGFTGCRAISLDSQSATSDIRIKGNILKGVISGTDSEGIGIYGNDADITAKIYNNTVYDFINGTTANNASIAVATGGNYYIYNNTLRGSYVGVDVAAGTVIAKNNLFSACTTAASGTFAAGTDYNATNTSSMSYTVTGEDNTHDRVSQTFTFVDANAKDFHLSTSDVGATDVGVDLSSDSVLSFSDDVDTALRWVPWSIGADHPADSVATGVTSGNWSEASTWASGIVPSATQDVYIASGKTVTFDKNDSATSLTATKVTVAGILVIDASSVARTMVLQGNIVIADGGLLQMRGGDYNASIIFNCATNGQYGLTVNSGGTLDIQGTSKYDRDCVITTITQDGSHNAGMIFSSGSKVKIKFADISYMGSNQSAGWGVYAFSIDNYNSNEYFYIEGCRVHHGQRGIMLNSCANTVIYDNFIDQNDYGVYVYDTAGTTGNIICSNCFYDNDYRTIELQSAGGYHSVINNVIGSNAGITIYVNGTSNSHIYNNTLNDNSSTGISITASANNNIVKNNIISNQAGTAIGDSGSGTVIDYNLFYNNTSDGTTTAGGGTVAYTGTNPNYVSTDSTSVNFLRLGIDSTALGAGCRLDTGAAQSQTNIGARLDYVYNLTDTKKYNFIQQANDAADCSAGDTIVVYTVDVTKGVE